MREFLKKDNSIRQSRLGQSAIQFILVDISIILLNKQKCYNLKNQMGLNYD
jgi:hypothetical protein